MSARVLVIDDDVPLLEAVRAALEGAGYEVETSSQPLELALDLSRVRPDLVLLDVAMPDVRGTDVLATLKANAGEIRAWVALFSSLPEDELQRLAEEAGARGWIRKASPFSPGRLARQVRKLLLDREREHAARPAPARALVVDDSFTMRQILRRVLEDAEIQVEEACHGREALEVIGARDEPPGLLLVDLNMPEMDGYELVTEVRAQHDASRVRILMVTSETDLTRIQRALAAGADEYLMKPFSGASVREKLECLGFALR